MISLTLRPEGSINMSEIDKSGSVGVEATEFSSAQSMVIFSLE
jgi:hypothetical protein